EREPCPTRPCPTGPCPTRPCPTGPRPTGPRPTRPRPTRPRPTRPRPIGLGDCQDPSRYCSEMARILTILGRVGLAARPAPAQPGPEPTGQGRGLSVAGSGPRVALGDLLGLELGLVLEVDVDDVLVLDVVCLALGL